MHAKWLQSCLTLHDSMYCSLPGSSVHGISPGKIPEWVAMLSSGIFPTQGSNLHPLHCRQSLSVTHWGSLRYALLVPS